jgi:eukaryotic-like serine/threonine-protein kinase
MTMMQKTLNLDDLPVRPGELIAGKYRVLDILGKGGMGVVAAAMHEELEERVAIKFLLLDESNKAALGRRFLREARLAVKIKSDHVVRVIDLGRLEDGMPYMVMEYLVGRDLSTVLRQRGRLPIGEAVEYMVQVCAGVAAAHALGIIHRDIKPANLFLTTGPTGEALVKVLDFGISKHLSAENAEPPLTEPSMVMGSLKYMSPEQIRSTSEADTRSDVWSLGVILHEMLTGKRPFVSNEPMGVVAAICSDPPVLLRHELPEASEALEAILLRCFEKNVNERMQSALDLACALDPFREPVRSRSAVFTLPSISMPIPLTPAGSAGAAGDSRKGALLSDVQDSVDPEGVGIPGETDSKPTLAEIALVTSSYSALLRRLPAMLATAIAGAALAGGTIAFVSVHSWRSRPPPQATTTAAPSVPARAAGNAARAADPAPAGTPPSSASVPGPSATAASLSPGSNSNPHQTKGPLKSGGFGASGATSSPQSPDRRIPNTR